MGDGALFEKTTADFRPHFPVDCSNRPVQEFRLVCWADIAADDFTRRIGHARNYEETTVSSNSGKIGIGLAGAVACAGLLSAGVAGAATVVVSPANMEGWSFQSFDGNFAPVSSGNYLGTAQMVNGPGTPPFGTGSANLATNPGYGNGSEALRNGAEITSRYGKGLLSLGCTDRMSAVFFEQGVSHGRLRNSS